MQVLLQLVETVVPQELQPLLVQLEQQEQQEQKVLLQAQVQMVHQEVLVPLVQVVQ
jgi:hypothetical protein